MELIARHLPSSSLLPLAALLALLGMFPAAAAPVRPCSDACFEAARGAYRECASSASGAFMDATGSCVERTLECVDACRSRRQACRDATGAGAELAGCLVELATAKGQCPNEFPPGSIRRALCFHRAELAGLRCRSGVRRRLRTALRDCRAGFAECVSTCGPGEPPGGVVTCRAEGKAAFRAMRAGCRRTLQVTASGCLEKVVTCVPDCADARDACSAPTRATLAAALVTCTAQERAGMAACQAANPGAGPALEQCTIVAQANASTCRDAAVEAAGPGIGVCAQQYVRCIRACPPA